MIQDIELIGVDKEVIDELIDKLDYSDVLNLACNYEIVKNNIDLLKSLGVKNIDDLLINRSSLFLEKSEKLRKKFSEFNIPVFVNLINMDYTVVDELFG